MAHSNTSPPTANSNMAVRWRIPINNTALGRSNQDSRKGNNIINNSHNSLALDTTTILTNNMTAPTAVNGSNSNNTGSINNSGTTMLKSETLTIRGLWSMYSNASLGTTVVGSVVQVIPTMGNEMTM